LHIHAREFCFNKLVEYHANMTDNVEKTKHETEDQELNDLLDSKYTLFKKSSNLTEFYVASLVL